MTTLKHINDYNTIVWDWNGTLLDDSKLCMQIANTLLVNHNDIQLRLEGYRAVFGFPIVDYYKRIGIDLQKESFEELTKKFIPAYNAAVKTCQLHGKALDVLTKFDETKSDQFILTAGHKESVTELLHHYSIRKFFKEVEGLDNFRAESKVDRGIQLIRKNQIKVGDTVLIGDTIHDYDVAKAIGVDCILIAKGHQSKERLIDKSKGEIIVLNDVAELLSL